MFQIYFYFPSKSLFKVLKQNRIFRQSKDCVIAYGSVRAAINYRQDTNAQKFDTPKETKLAFKTLKFYSTSKLSEYEEDGKEDLINTHNWSVI